jgi:asparagine synthase (glutamine-hydrolysing)
MLYDSVSELERKGLSGCIIEAGCALGGSSIVIAHAKAAARVFRVFDVFSMIPAPGESDPPEVHARYKQITSGESAGIGGDKYYGYEIDLLALVRDNLRRFGIHEQSDNVGLVKGLIQDQLVVTGPVAFAHIDVDWHDPVACCLERVFPNLVVGGSVVIDDYHDWEGCKRAVDEFLHQHGPQVVLDSSAGSLKITRTER